MYACGKILKDIVKNVITLLDNLGIHKAELMLIPYRPSLFFNSIYMILYHRSYMLVRFAHCITVSHSDNCG